MTIEMKVPAHSDKLMHYEEKSTVYEDRKKSSVFGFSYSTNEVETIVEEKKQAEEITEATKAADSIAGHKPETTNSTTKEEPQAAKLPPKFASALHKAGLSPNINQEQMKGATPDLAKIIHGCCCPDGRSISVSHVQAALDAGLHAKHIAALAAASPAHLRSFAESKSLDEATFKISSAPKKAGTKEHLGTSYKAGSMQNHTVTGSSEEEARKKHLEANPDHEIAVVTKVSEGFENITDLMCKALGWEVLEESVDGLPVFSVLDGVDVLAECTSFTKHGAKKVLERKIDGLIFDLVEGFYTEKEILEEESKPVDMNTVKNAIKSLVNK